MLCLQRKKTNFFSVAVPCSYSLSIRGEIIQTLEPDSTIKCVPLRTREISRSDRQARAAKQKGHPLSQGARPGPIVRPGERPSHYLTQIKPYDGRKNKKLGWGSQESVNTSMVAPIPREVIASHIGFSSLKRPCFTAYFP